MFFPSRGEIPEGRDLLMKDDIVKLKRCIYAAQVGISFGLIQIAAVIFICRLIKLF